jgi:hypothetical protein
MALGALARGRPRALRCRMRGPAHRTFSTNARRGVGGSLRKAVLSVKTRKPPWPPHSPAAGGASLLFFDVMGRGRAPGRCCRSPDRIPAQDGQPSLASVPKAGASARRLTLHVCREDQIVPIIDGEEWIAGRFADALGAEVGVRRTHGLEASGRQGVGVLIPNVLPLKSARVSAVTGALITRQCAL